jgi:nucleoside-diphosphate-sugar epimerase
VRDERVKVLLTGAFGNLGAMVVRELERRAIAVRCTDLPSARSRRAARALAGRVEVAWGDVRDAGWLARQVEDVDAVIHLAGLLPPLTETQPALAEAVNVTATQQLVAALARSPRRPLLLYPSSLTVFGVTQDRPPPRRVSDPVRATDQYTRHKLAVERLLAESPISWVVFRIGVSVDARTLAADAGTLRKLVAVRPDNRLEWVHPADVAVAMANAVQRREAVDGRILLIGGGPRCQVTQAEFLGAALGALGLRWSARHHGRDGYYTDWLDTEESQRLLDYQRHGFEDYRAELSQRLRWPRRLLWPLRPLVDPLLAALAARLAATRGNAVGAAQR